MNVAQFVDPLKVGPGKPARVEFQQEIHQVEDGNRHLVIALKDLALKVVHQVTVQQIQKLDAVQRVVLQHQDIVALAPCAGLGPAQFLLPRVHISRQTQRQR